VREPLRSPAAPPAGLGWPQGGPPGCGHGFARLAEQREGEGGGREGQEERKEREGRKWRRGAREPLEKLTHQADCMRKTPNCAGEAPTRAADDEKFDDVALQLLPDCGGVPSSSSSSSSISSETSSIYPPLLNFPDHDKAAIALAKNLARRRQQLHLLISDRIRVAHPKVWPTGRNTAPHGNGTQYVQARTSAAASVRSHILATGKRMRHI